MIQATWYLDPVRRAQRHRRIEFSDFMNRVVRRYKGKEIRVVLDNLSIHKAKWDLSLARHLNVHFYTPTHTRYGRTRSKSGSRPWPAIR
jgi:hypothetical protein